MVSHRVFFVKFVYNPQEMATLKEYYEKDLSSLLKIGNSVSISNATSKLEIPIALHLEFNSNSKFLSYFIPQVNDAFEVCKILLINLSSGLGIFDNIHVSSGLPGEELMKGTDLRFSGRVFIYSEAEIDLGEFKKVEEELKQQGIFIHLRGPLYAEERSRLEKPLAFISHDSRDKDLYARDIAIGLTKMMCPVWYDEYSLKVGDRLRESIEKGIRECKKCILILSPNFLSNSGWTKAEFNSIFTRELIEETDYILPVWCGISKKEVFEYSPMLADRVGVKFDEGIDDVLKKLYRSINN